MFWLKLIIGITIMALSICWLVHMYKRSKRRLWRLLTALLFVLGLYLTVGAFNTAQGMFYLWRIIAVQPTTWLVVDYHHDVVTCHWVLRSGYVDRSDGWHFYDANGNLCHVSDDAFVMQIKEPLDEFLQTYRSRYNIPVDQVALE